MFNQECYLLFDGTEALVLLKDRLAKTCYFFGFPTLCAVENMLSTVSISLA